ncbi:hypothetical protein MNBD_GAMMA11-2227 [hydrothermal vent metagenome]|uniref:Uncharacterized protein n=1 Tax=hydrothermal vent metagenome TaxID=652676 RepID=A0A3B0X0G1_9ZZZZ
MKFSEDYASGSYIIRAFSDNKIEINNTCYENSLVISKHHLDADWGISHITQMTHEVWQKLIKDKPEVILIGTGSTLVFPHPSSYAPTIEQGIGVEFMDSGAACRTYNVLLSEERRVLAGIIL